MKGHAARTKLVVAERGEEGNVKPLELALKAFELLDPAQGIAPGQAAVMYDGTRVVGSATIISTGRLDRR